MAPGDSISGKVRILIDMDGVLCDWERKLFEFNLIHYSYNRLELNFSSFS